MVAAPARPKRRPARQGWPTRCGVLYPGVAVVIRAGCARVTPDLLLALVAWPEADVVAPGVIADAPPPVALYRREPALRLLRTQLDDGDSGARAVFSTLDSCVVDAEVLPDVAVDADAH